MTEEVVQLIGYPLRPVNGGSLDLNPPPLPSEWHYEPKLNGRRGVLHLPSKTMWNRHGDKSALDLAEFRNALAMLYYAFPNQQWLDIEILYGRNPVGRGSICVLDIMGTSFNCSDRWQLLTRCLPTLDGSLIDIPENQAFCLPRWSHAQRMKLWDRTKEASATLRHTVWEGVVGKRADSLYPLQTISPEREFPYWVKFRWAVK